MASAIRILSPDDAPAYLALRLRALREHPEAFATSESEESRRSAAELARRLQPGPEQVTVGAFENEHLLGFAALVRGNRARQRHRARLAGMYVAPESRGRGQGRALVERVLVLARQWRVSDVALAVTVGNGAARALYASIGFVSYGVESRGLRVDTRYYDVELMNLRIS